MISVNGKVVRWRDGLGIVIPRAEAEKRRIREGDQVNVLFLKKATVLEEIFGKIRLGESVEKLMKESDRMLYDE